MNNQEIKAAQQKGSEISLIDIIAIFVRFRYLIIGIILLATIVAIICTIILPPLIVEKAIKASLFEAVVSTSISNSVQSFTKPELVDTFVQQILTEPVIILQAFRQSGMQAIDGVDLTLADEDQLLFAIRRRLVDNQTFDGQKLTAASQLFKVEKANGGYRIAVKHENSAAAQKFLLALIDQTNAKISLLLETSAMAEVENYERIFGKDYVHEAIDQNLMDTVKRYNAARRFLDGADMALLVVQAPYVLTQKPSLELIRAGLRKKAVLAVGASTFLAVFLAFILNWMAMVRSDPVAMNILRSAWKKQKKLR